MRQQPRPVHRAGVPKLFQALRIPLHLEWNRSSRSREPGLAGVQRIVLNGSFVTDIMEPNDVDCVLLVGRGFPADPIAEAELTAGLPFLEMKLVGRADFDDYVSVTFGTDRMGIPKGTIEIIP